MTSIPCPSCSTPVRILAPDLVVAYLYRTGWLPASPGGVIMDAGVVEWRMYERREDVLSVACVAAYRDYPRCFLETLADIARIESRPIPAILDDMAGTEPSDLDPLRSALRAAVLGWEIAVEALAVETGHPALPETRARIDACRELLGDER